MDKITITKTCSRCSRGSTYVKRKIKGREFFVCDMCGAKLCKADDIMLHAFPSESKPLSNKAKQHKTQGKKKDPYQKSKWR